MEMESEEKVGVEYRIFAADGTNDHMLFTYGERLPQPQLPAFVKRNCFSVFKPMID